MIEAIIAKRYARALLSLATQKDKATIDLFGTQLQNLQRLCQENDALLRTLSNRYFDLFARERIIEAISMKLGFAPEVKNFIKLLIRKGRIGIFPFVLQEYKTLANERMNRQPMTVISTVALPENELKNLARVFSKRFDKEMIVNQKVDPKLLGGVRVHIGDKVYDYTLKNQIERLKQRLVA